MQEKWSVKPLGKCGAPQIYSNEAIQMLLMLKAVYSLPYRMLEGFSRSLMVQMNLDFRIPNHTTMSRRARKVKISIPCKARTEPIHLVVGRLSWLLFMHQRLLTLKIVRFFN